MEATGSFREIMTLSEASEFIRVSEKTLRKSVALGQVPGQKVGREWRFLRSALAEWLATSHAETNTSSGRMETSQLSSPVEAKAGFGDSAFTENRDKPLHRWVPWIAGFSGAFVNDVLDRVSAADGGTLLDPFAGVGTTLVEGMKRGLNVVGFEINPYAALACKVKLEAHKLDVGKVRGGAERFAAFVRENSENGGREPETGAPRNFVSRVPFFSPRVERQVLFALDFIRRESDPDIADFLRVAMGATMVGFSNYSYEPSLSRREVAGKAEIVDADVSGVLSRKLAEMCEDAEWMEQQMAGKGECQDSRVWGESYFEGWRRVSGKSVDVLITSPPYLNNYHYIRNTRPQMYWLGLVSESADLRTIEEQSFGKFWQTVRSGPGVRLTFKAPELEEKISVLSRLNAQKGDYGGRGWANYAATYFNDCKRFCEATAGVMRPGGLVVVVIGNNILQGIEFETDEFFAKIAQESGFEVVEMHRVRRKRTGSSIINSTVRVGSPKDRTELYETAVELRAGD